MSFELHHFPARLSFWTFILTAVLPDHCILRDASDPHIHSGLPFDSHRRMLRFSDEETDRKKTYTQQDIRRFYEEFLHCAVFLSNIPTNSCSRYPLNGYALLSVAMTGFLPIVFTHMLLQYCRIQFWFFDFLSFISWFLSTVVFFLLQRHLIEFNSSSEIEDASLRQLYQVPSCGGSSALVLCTQTIGTSPLAYLSGYYNASGIFDIDSIPIIWVWNMICLVLIFAAQVIRKPHFSSSMKKKRGTNILRLLYLTASHSVTLLIVPVIFGLCLGYQAQMILNYTKMDVIDRHGWSFGQVVAVVVWFPPVIQYFHDVLRGTLLA